MSKFIDKATEFGARIGAQRHLASLRDGFISLMPLIMVGSAAVIVNNVPIKGWNTILPAWIAKVCSGLWWGTFGFLAIFIVFSIAYHLAQSYEGDPLRTGLVALASYLAIIPQTAVINNGNAWGWIGWQYTSTSSLFVAIIVSFIAAELFIRFNRNPKLLIKLPPAVPPAVGKAFSVLIPAGLTISIVALIGVIVESLTGNDVFDFVNTLFIPLIKASDSMASGILIILLNQSLWILGLHGSNIIGGVFEPISLNLMNENILAFSQGLPMSEIPHIMTKPFVDTFVHLGGSGATLGLIIALFLVGKSKLSRTMGKACIGPASFEINEPIVFGLPVVLNPILAIPFIFGPVVLVVISYLATAWGFVNKCVVIIPWATPPIISGILSTGGDWRAPILQIINITLMILIYMPFVKIMDRLEVKKEQEGK